LEQGRLGTQQNWQALIENWSLKIGHWPSNSAFPAAQWPLINFHGLHDGACRAPARSCLIRASGIRPPLPGCRLREIPSARSATCQRTSLSRPHYTTILWFYNFIFDLIFFGKAPGWLMKRRLRGWKTSSPRPSAPHLNMRARRAQRGKPQPKRLNDRFEV